MIKNKFETLFVGGKIVINFLEKTLIHEGSIHFEEGGVNKNLNSEKGGSLKYFLGVTCFKFGKGEL